MLMWNSEEIGITEHTKDIGYFPIDDENGALVIANYPTTGSRIAIIGFLGPNEKANAERWDEFAGDTEHDIVTNTEEALTACFG